MPVYGQLTAVSNGEVVPGPDWKQFVMFHIEQGKAGDQAVIAGELVINSMRSPLDFLSLLKLLIDLE